jgi:hypothetical protein
MRLPRRQFLHLAAGAASLPAMSRIAVAQSYPVLAFVRCRRSDYALPPSARPPRRILTRLMLLSHLDCSRATPRFVGTDLAHAKTSADEQRMATLRHDGLRRCTFWGRGMSVIETKVRVAHCLAAAGQKRHER